MLLFIVLIVIFLTLSSFFSGMEAAIFSISRFRVKTLVFDGRKGAKALDRLKKEPGKTLASLLLSNLVVNIGASSIATIILTMIIETYSVNKAVSFIVEFALMTSVLLIWGEITPKIIALANAEFFALKFSGIVGIISAFFSPISHFSERFIRWLLPATGHKVTDKEVRFMLREAKRFGIMDDHEEKHIYQILKFGNMMVKEVMTPRAGVIGVSEDDTLQKAREIIIAKHHSRLCIYNQTGEITGVLFAKDLFLTDADPEVQKVSLLMRKPYIVPESKPLDDLLTEFRKKGVHFGIVKNDKAVFTGIITLDDVLQTLFGSVKETVCATSDVSVSKS